MNFKFWFPRSFETTVEFSFQEIRIISNKDTTCSITLLLVNKNYFAMFHYSLHDRFSHDSDFDFMITLSFTSGEGGLLKF